MRFFSILLFVLLPYISFAQITESLDKAQQEIERKHYYHATELLEQYLVRSKDSTVLQTLGYTHAMQGHQKQAIEWFEKSQDAGIKLTDENTILYAQQLYVEKRFDALTEVLNNYDGADLRSKNNLLDGVKNYDLFYIDEDLYEVQRLSLNSTMSDFALIAYDSGFLFTSNRSFDDKTKKELEYNYFKLYFTQSDDFKSFTQPSEFEPKLGIKGNDGPIAFFPSEQKAIVSRNNYHRGIRGITHRGTNEIELYEIEKNAKGEWKELLRLPFDSDDFSTFHPVLSSDGTWMIFASNRPGGYGGSDLYKVSYTNQQWSEPENLGSEINTPQNELFPTLLGDSVLYFSSDGHVGMGGLDIYRSNLAQPKAINLGSPFNSTEDDLSWFYLDAQRQVISTDRGKEQGDDDMILIRQTVDKNPANIDTKSPSAAAAALPSFDIWCFQNLSLPIQGIGLDSQRTFQFVLDDNLLTLTGDKDASLPLNNASKIKEQLSKTISISNYHEITPFFFQFASDELINDETKLDMLISLLKQNEGINITLYGYTDSKGAAAFNLALAKRRAQSVKDLLTQQGIASSRIQVISKGETQLLTNCGTQCTDEEHKHERRVEVEIN
ncbi:hypothetical protein BFP72_13235 [Reichenbachiella sp. 5M10]|uniref:OmpA family protein n=1 Tax=Reichenbachiella sp. 5M10 TaxID=1889772 RepID=UPI000C14ED5F|nr:OmpA family protein [Reichenbachiella sp. 5M10]PIB36287.1 hypothetical protein BFP72_13235 [Reichenbachiella sp. 5M10]